MIVVEGIEKAIIGWANIGTHRVAVYSVDRISILIEDDIGEGTTSGDIEEIVRFLELSSADRAVDENIPPPIFVHSADWSDIERLESYD